MIFIKCTVQKQGFLALYILEEVITIKKRAIVFAAIFVLLLSTQAYAITARSTFAPVLTFDGTTAKCSVSVTGTLYSDKVSVVLKLWQGSECIATWDDEQTYYVAISKSTTVKRGQSYMLTADVTINGVSQPTTDSGTHICR